MLHLRSRSSACIFALAALGAASLLAGNRSRADEPTPAAPLIGPQSQQPPEPMPEPTPAAKANEPWSILPKGDATTAPDEASSDDHIVRFDQPPTGEPMDNSCDNGWTSQWVPTGIIYHSYMAGPQEPRAAMFIHSDQNGGALGDATLGGREGFWKYGNNDPTHPEGWQVDFYGAAIARLDLEHQEDLNSCDYVFGLPITYGNEVWQTKFGYAHLSSHLGDEYAISHPGSLSQRINYSRDSFVWGNSYYPIPALRLYEEFGWAIRRDDHAGRWTSQFGTELSRPGPTGPKMTPFVALNGRLRDDDKDLMGDVNLQAGWLRRGILGQTLRIGVDYYNGKSDQSQFYNNFEQQIGGGIWYDF